MYVPAVSLLICNETLRLNPESMSLQEIQDNCRQTDIISPSSTAAIGRRPMFAAVDGYIVH